MGNSDDIKMKNEMIKMLESMQEYSKELKEKQEISLWKRAGSPCLLHEALTRLTKIELDEIRKAHNFSNMSALKKADLCIELSLIIPIVLNRILYTWDEERYEFLYGIISQKGVIPYESVSPREREELRKSGLLYHGIKENEKILFIPEDLLVLFKNLDYKELSSILKRNTDWILLTQGLLYYIGVSEYWNVMAKIESMTKKKIDARIYLDVIFTAIEYYDQLELSGGLIYHKDVKNLSKVMKEQDLRKNVPDYPFSIEQLRKAGRPGYIDKSPEMNTILEFLEDSYDIPKDKSDVIAEDMLRIINQTGDPIQLMKYFEKILEFPDFEWIQIFQRLVTKLYNNSRQWELRGYTPEELGKIRGTQMKSSGENVFVKPAIVTVPPKKSGSLKIGRNDPCPCGSGKKYKKCCGRG